MGSPTLRTLQEPILLLALGLLSRRRLGYGVGAREESVPHDAVEVGSDDDVGVARVALQVVEFVDVHAVASVGHDVHQEAAPFTRVFFPPLLVVARADRVANLPQE
jgi:hypothetical protein